MWIGSPFYIIESNIDCWKCGRSMKAVCLAAGRISEETRDDLAGIDPGILLQGVARAPEKLISELQLVNPGYQIATSKTRDSQYYMNHCECGAYTGDHFLFSQPGGGFFPLEERDAEKISIHQVGVEGVYEIESEYSYGAQDIIFEHAKL